jgi:two-component system KDP operon response regulator KdpE
MGRALLVEESAELRATLSEYLQGRGIDIYLARGAADARALLPAIKPDVTTLDLDFEDGDGFDLIEDIGRAGSRCLVVTDRDQVKDRLRALSLGADDYMTKPVHLEELYLRLRNIVTHRSANAAAANAAIIDINGVKIDLVRRALLNRDGAVGPELTESELALLRVLAEGMDRIVHKDKLFETVYGRPYTPGTRSLDVSVSRLRLKLRSTDIPVELRSVRQAGYMMSQSRPR